MAGFKREIFYYKRYYLDFFNKLDVNVQKKFNWTLQLISGLEMIPSKYFKHVEGVIGLYEIRVELEGNIFRAFAFFDKGKIIIIGNGFQKKTQKTPKPEIELALRIKKEYFNEKDNKR